MHRSLQHDCRCHQASYNRWCLAGYLPHAFDACHYNMPQLFANTPCREPVALLSIAIAAANATGTA